jgi:hypothetical protein
MRRACKALTNTIISNGFFDYAPILVISFTWNVPKNGSSIREEVDVFGQG